MVAALRTPRSRQQPVNLCIVRIFSDGLLQQPSRRVEVSAVGMRVGEIDQERDMLRARGNGLLVPLARGLEVAGETKDGADQVERCRVATLCIRCIQQRRLGHAHAAAGRVQLGQPRPGGRMGFVVADRILEGGLG